MPKGLPVRIGNVELGIEFTESNPQSITYRTEFNIIKHECVPKPKTQCAQPQGLWGVTMQFVTTQPDRMFHLFEMDAGPHWVVTDLLPGIAMYLKSKQAVQEPGDPHVFKWTLDLIQAYDGEDELGTGD